MDSSTVISSGFPPGQKEQHYQNADQKIWLSYLVQVTDTLTSYIQSIVTGKLCKRRHVVGVIRQYMGLLCNAPGSLLNTLIVCVLRNKNKPGMKFVLPTFLIPLTAANLFLTCLEFLQLLQDHVVRHVVKEPVSGCEDDVTQLNVKGRAVCGVRAEGTDTGIKQRTKWIIF